MTTSPANRPLNLHDAKIRALMFDLDGVIYRGNTAIPGAAQLISNLQTRKIPFLFITNNASLTSKQFQDKLAKLEIYVETRQILSSSIAAARWLKEQKQPEPRVFVVGEAGLQEALQNHGAMLVENWRDAKWVVAGLDRHASWEKLRDATLAIRNGERFIATNADATIPSEEGEVPGAGAIISFLRTATNAEPIVIGKPQAAMFMQALELLDTNAEETVMVGDRQETDILGASNVGIRTVGVLSGVTNAGGFATGAHAPTWIFESVAELNDALFGRDERNATSF